MNASEEQKSVALVEEAFVNIGQHLESVVRCYPNNTAIYEGSEQLSYTDFNIKVNQVAHTLLAEGVGIGERVALLFDQGAEAVIAMLAALKVGCVFVHLDGSYPTGKLQEICGSCSPKFILTDSAHETQAEGIATSSTSVINIEQLSGSPSESNPEVDVAADATAYIFYTSGSTGNPKGVCQTQRNLFHFIRVYSGSLGVTSNDRLTLLYSLGFSASNMDVFSALLTGATLYPYDIKKHGTASLATWIEKNQISILHAVPTVYRHLCNSLDDGSKLKTIRGIDLGGEAVQKRDVEFYKKHFSEDCILINHLAATEVSVIAQYKIDRDFEYEGEMLPVGYAADGVTLRVVDSEGQEVEKGQTGEIQICSAYVSSGYWQMPELNSKVFRDDEAVPGGRMYLSGDLGYVGKDGKFYFLGRKDNRVKIRGYSVDTGEVETAIRQCFPTLKDVSVVARRLSESSPTELTAFIVPVQEETIDPRQLRQSLSSVIATYMVPAEFIFMDQLPENASGKIDRKALAALDLREQKSKVDFIEPKSDTEKKLASLIAKTLKIKQVGLLDDFFLLGGDSLRATKLHTEVESAFATRIPLHLLFKKTDVEGMASKIDESFRQKNSDEYSHREKLIPLNDQGGQIPLYLTHGDKGQAFVSPHFLSILGPDQPVYAFQASGLERPENRHWSIQEMAEQYIAAMKEIQPHGPYLVGSICAGSMVAIEIAQQLLKAGEQLAPLLIIDPPVDPPGEKNWFRRVRREWETRFKRRFSEQKFNRKLEKELKNFASRGRIALDTSSNELLKIAYRVAFDFRLALNDYRLKPYDGDVYYLASQSRIGRGKRRFLSKLTGDVTVLDVGERHGDIHDVSNDRFGEQLTSAMEAIADKL